MGKFKVPLRFFGAKNQLASWIIDHFPPHRCYVEPFGGSGAVLLNKWRSSVEVYNDLLSEVVNFYEVLRELPDELARAIELTPYSEDEFYNAKELVGDRVNRARLFAVRSWQTRSSEGVRWCSSFRASGAVRTPSTAIDWCGVPERVRGAAERFRGVIILNRDAVKVMEGYDNEETLHFVDPPYMPSTRTGNGRYAHEYSEEDHVCLLERLVKLKGKVVLCGYDSELYHDMLSNWNVSRKSAVTQGHSKRTEVLWCNFPLEKSLFN